jgi:hypothetical protein
MVVSKSSNSGTDGTDRIAAFPLTPDLILNLWTSRLESAAKLAGAQGGFSPSRSGPIPGQMPLNEMSGGMQQSSALTGGTPALDWFAAQRFSTGGRHGLVRIQIFHRTPHLGNPVSSFIDGRSQKRRRPVPEGLIVPHKPTLSRSVRAAYLPYESRCPRSGLHNSLI